MEAVRELLGMEVAYATEFNDTHGVLTYLQGDGQSFGISEGMVDAARADLLPADPGRAAAESDPRRARRDRAASMPITQAADVGAFASVPVVFSDGRLYGTLCAGSHDAKPDLGYQELRFLHVLARLVADTAGARGAPAPDRGARAQRQPARARSGDLHRAPDRGAGARLLHGRPFQGSRESAAAVARELGLSEREVIDVKQVALLHDIGKIALPDGILRKPGPLDDEEWKAMRHHPIHGAEMVAAIPGLRHLAPMVRAEHERWDGGGYPDGLAGEDIPLASRITLVCDAYHAMTSDRPYRRALSAEHARAEVVEGLGSQFCPTAGRALLATLDG